jgi:CheY-like chemotaxis protein
MDDVNFDGKIIGVVDDSEIVLKGMRGLLEAYGATVLTYNNGHDFLRDIPFVDCLVVDYYMPDFDGLSLVSELRNRAYGASVIILTGMRNEIPAKRVVDLQVRHLVKNQRERSAASSGSGLLLALAPNDCLGSNFPLPGHGREGPEAARLARSGWC